MFYISGPRSVALGRGDVGVVADVADVVDADDARAVTAGW
jgi:hypothetical protein